MRRRVLLDTGPLVAYLDRRDRYHAWARDRWAEIPAPFLTCEAVLSESCFLLQRFPSAVEAVLEMLNRGVLAIGIRLDEESGPVAGLMSRYRNVPMSLADACLVRMTEQHGDARVLTVDGDFRIYRKSGRQVIPTIMP